MLAPSSKKLVFRKTEIKTPPLSTAARVEIGQLLRRLLQGEMLQLPQSRPMPSIAPHVHELRVNDQDQTWRLIYRIDPEAIVVVELFSKKTPATPPTIIERCQKRFKTYDADQRGNLMDAQTQQNLESRGYTVSDASALLELTPEEETLVDTGLVLSNLVRQTRLARGLTQKQLAERLGTRQPNIARLETAAGTSFDALFQALYAMQVSPREIAAALEGVDLRTSEMTKEAALVAA